MCEPCQYDCYSRDFDKLNAEASKLQAERDAALLQLKQSQESDAESLRLYRSARDRAEDANRQVGELKEALFMILGTVQGSGVDPYTDIQRMAKAALSGTSEKRVELCQKHTYAAPDAPWCSVCGADRDKRIARDALCTEKRKPEPPCPSGIRGELDFKIGCYREANHCGCHIGKKADGTDTSWSD